MDQHTSLLRKDIVEAWERYTNKTYTGDDLALILDSVLDDDHFQAFDEVANAKIELAKNALPSTPEERKAIYRQQAIQLLAEYENKQKAQVLARNKTGRFRKFWYAAAAVLMLGLLIPSVYLYRKSPTAQIPQYVNEITLKGEIRTILLPDRTEVTLNAESHIIYPAHFAGDERAVELYGEALFNVTPDTERPFTVKTENMKIKVVGTVFGIKEYADDLTASVSVASGKVAVAMGHDPLSSNTPLLLERDQQVKLEKATGIYEKTIFDADKYLSWTDGTLYFNRTPILEVVNMLNRRFPQVNIRLAEGDYSMIQISGEHDNVHTIEDILNSISYITGLKYKKEKNRYTFYNNH